MQNDLNIAIIQTDLIWKDKQANLSNFKDLIKTIQKKVDIIVLPELFNTAFCIDDMNLAEDENGETIAFMKAISVEKTARFAAALYSKKTIKSTTAFYLYMKIKSGIITINTIYFLWLAKISF